MRLINPGAVCEYRRRVEEEEIGGPEVYHREEGDGRVGGDEDDEIDLDVDEDPAYDREVDLEEALAMNGARGHSLIGRSMGFHPEAQEDVDHADALDELRDEVELGEGHREEEHRAGEGAGDEEGRNEGREVNLEKNLLGRGNEEDLNASLGVHEVLDSEGEKQQTS